MIGHFPSPYPDELLYSVCARFSDRVAYPNAKSVLKELLGASTATATIALPSRISYLVAALPTGAALTEDRLIENHTLYPFFNSFLPPERVKQFYADMKSGKGQAAYMRSGVMGSNIPMPTHLRFCPLCKRKDEVELGETYWRRLHQLPGVKACPLHQVFLENSDVSLRARRNNLLFISADQATHEVPIRRIDLSVRDHKILLQIASAASGLLNQSYLSTSLNSLYNRYLRLLINRGLATYTGSIHVGKLIDEFRSFYPPSQLKLLHCEFTGTAPVKSNWLLRLVRPPKHAQHPVYHLLLIQFLGCTVEEFFRLPDEVNFFGEGPWFCLNPAADHYKRPVIVELQAGKRLRDNKPVGIFSCECRFAFARTGPDSTPEDRFRIGRMISFGPVWEAKLKDLWKYSSLSLSEIGRRLGVDPLTVRRHATRLKLSFSRSGRSSKPLNRATQLKGRHTSTAWEKKRRTYRTKWLYTINRNRNIKLKALRQKSPRVYAWLRQNDFEWLKGHRPRSERHIQSTSSINWRRRDAEYVTAVRDAALQIKNAYGRPIRITKTAIGKTIGALTLLQQKLHKMPLTTRILENVVETRVEFAIRRIWWTVKLYREENLLPQTWQLILRANVYKLRNVAKIKEAIIVALQELKSNLHYNEGVRIAL
jgi:hypothetical protein